jgi:L-cysteine desulfidase
MKRDDPRYQNYIAVLKEELIPAMGCTEPVAVAYAAAKARETLGASPDKVLVEVSGNIVKNVKSVVVPNTGGLKGLKAAAAAGIVAGKAEKKLEVISVVSEAEQKKIAAFLEKIPIEVKMADTGRVLEIIITVYAGTDASGKSEHSARVRIIDAHTNVVNVEKDGKTVFKGNETPVNAGAETADEADRTMLEVEAIIDFADTVDLDDVREMIDRQINYNSAISAEGLKNNWGANIGKVLRATWADDVKVRAKAAAAAGSDARMSGCGLPVIILSGSGNQGMTASLPVIEYAKHFKKSHDELLRALVVSDLLTIHLKTGIGRLSAYCGVVCAGASAGAGIAYLDGGRLDAVAHTLVNALAVVSGIVCDGAKPSCAAKIGTAVEAGIMGYEMYKNGQEFYGGDGIVAHGVENTIRNISRLGKEGMKKTDKEIIEIMLSGE